MPDDIQNADASVANNPDTIAAATPSVESFQIQAPDAADNGVADDAELTALADDLEYILTVGQALERFSAAGRKAPSERTIQRYCIEGRLAAKKIRTVFGSEWLINESSLARLIASEPVVVSDAGVANSAATPSSPPLLPPKYPILEADTNDISVAGDAIAPSMATPVGERRTVAEVLIENARLLAQVEGRDAIIAELKEDRSFLREEVREGRRTRDDVKNIAERMLDTLRSMAIGRSLGPASNQESSIRATIIDP